MKSRLNQILYASLYATVFIGLITMPKLMVSAWKFVSFYIHLVSSPYRSIGLNPNDQLMLLCSDLIIIASIVLLVIGLVRYFITKQDNISGILKLSVALLIYILSFSLLYFLMTHHVFLKIFNGSTLLSFFMLLFILTIALCLYISNKPSHLNERPRIYNNRKLRLFHLFTDALLLLPFVYVLRMSFYSRLDEHWETMLILLLVYLCYYFPLELVLQQTVAKIFTRTRVAVIGSFYWSILKRSMARLIPFEAFSFLIKNGRWHDRLSNTYLAKLTPEK
jgi:hypothetical protein